MKTLIRNVGQIVTMDGVEKKAGIGITRDDLGVIENGEVLIDGDTIIGVGEAGTFDSESATATINADGGVLMPALVDPHTHAIFVGNRHNEFEMRSEGASYLEIAEAGGGIVASTKAVQLASVEELTKIGVERLSIMAGFGIGVVEIKSGYGLTTESEIKMLEAAAAVAEQQSLKVVPTFMGAHALPRTYRDHPDKYVDIVIEKMLPEVAERKLARFCDVFAEKGFFTIEQSRKILLAAKELGLELKIHADEFVPLGGAQLAAELGAVSADHLLAVDDDGITALAKAGVTAVLLPGTSLYLGEGHYAPARKLIDSGVRVALATDLNPGSCYTENLPLIMTLACTNLKMTVAETLAAVTYNAARALLIEDRYGSITPGRSSTLALHKVDHYAQIPYHMAVTDLDTLLVDGQRVN